MPNDIKHNSRHLAARSSEAWWIAGGFSDLLGHSFPADLAAGHSLLAAACSGAMAAMFQQEAATSSAAPQAAAVSAPVTEDAAGTSPDTARAAAELQFDDRGLLHADSAQQTSSAAFESSHKVVPLPANLLHRVVNKFVVNSSGA